MGKNFNLFNKIFLYIINGVDVDVMSGFEVNNNTEIYNYIFD